ncbi:hypothetical protein E1178_01845 [Roseibium hamelinense]|nr:hypothetical protein [Roseibium hamelinense]
MSVFALTGTASAQSDLTFEDVFAAAEATTYKAQVVTTNPARNEIIVKADNKNEFSVPVQDGFDIGSVRKNQFLNVTYLAGVVIDIEKSEKTKPQVDVSKTVVLADQDRLPSGLSARQMTVTVKIETADKKTGNVRFTGPDGNERTYKVQNPDMLTDLNVSSGDLFDITFFDAIGIEITNT